MKRFTIDIWLRLIAGVFILFSVFLGQNVNPNYYWFTAFIGLNLFQSAFTGWCPMMSLLRRFGVPA